MTIYKYWNESWVKTKYKNLDEVWENGKKLATHDKLKSIHLDSNFHNEMYYYNDQFGHTNLFINDTRDKLKTIWGVIELIDNMFDLINNCTKDKDMIKSILKKHMDKLK